MYLFRCSAVHCRHRSSLVTANTTCALCVCFCSKYHSFALEHSEHVGMQSNGICLLFVCVRLTVAMLLPNYMRMRMTWATWNTTGCDPIFTQIICFCSPSKASQWSSLFGCCTCAHCSLLNEHVEACMRLSRRNSQLSTAPKPIFRWSAVCLIFNLHSTLATMYGCHSVTPCSRWKTLSIAHRTQEVVWPGHL